VPAQEAPELVQLAVEDGEDGAMEHAPLAHTAQDFERVKVVVIRRQEQAVRHERLGRREEDRGARQDRPKGGPRRLRVRGEGNPEDDEQECGRGPECGDGVEDHDGEKEGEKWGDGPD